jgi:YVTN family beta-propeller protein
VKTISFPEGSKPYMLRVAPDGQVVWVQSTGANNNVVLDVATMEILHTEPTGRGPVQSAFGPAGSRYGLVTHLDATFVLALERETGREAGRIEVGAPQANPSITPDGAVAYVTVPSRNEVVAIDMGELVVVGNISTGAEPMGVVVFDPEAIVLTD